MPDDDIKKKIEALQRRWTAASQEKAGLEGQLRAKKEELAAVVKEIREAGYDPKNIARERDQAREELEKIIAQVETELTEIETALAAFQK